MTKTLWLNLPVKNVKASKEFFTKLGFKFSPRFDDKDKSAGLLVGEKGTVVMLFEAQVFKGFIDNEIADTQQVTEVLLSIDAESKEEVDELVRKAVAAGGKTKHKPKTVQDWMYGCTFTDLDRHCWNVLYMDISKIPK